MPLKSKKGFTLLEVLVAVGVFLIFALGVYGMIHLVFKIVYQSRLTIIETAVLSEELEVARNLPYGDVGIVNGSPPGLLPHAKQVVRNGITFNVITTVRNIDDPFDGTIGGTPNDTSPADYKLVEMEIICQGCAQREPVTLSTHIAPKNLEGASQNGALFIDVFDSQGLPVAGANVHVVNYGPNPDLIIDDTTGNDGYLRLVDIPTGTLSYNIAVSKDGYTSAGTGAGKPAATVNSQSVTEIYFAIDKTANLNIATINPACAALGNTVFNLSGGELLSANPDVYGYNQNWTTNGAGVLALSGMRWGNYFVSASGTAYDVAGSIPMLPLNLLAGDTRDLSVILRPHTSHSLLVNVKDAGTGLPLSGASVRLYDGAGYDQTVVTGLGYARQTNWSGGSGQADFMDETRYWSDDGNLDLNSPAGTVRLKKVGSYYLASGYLESSTFDLGQAVDFHNVVFDPQNYAPEIGDTPLRVQLAASASSTPESWEFVGPDGASSSYFTPTSSSINESLDGNRYLRYRLFLSTDDDGFTPQFAELAFTYTNNCVPPGQAFFSGLFAGTYTLEVTRAGYAANEGEIEVAGTSITTVQMSTQ